MKRFIAIGIVLLVCTLAGVFYYSDNSVDAPMQQKVGVVLLSTRQESTWDEAHARGMEKAAEEKGVPVEWRENVTPDKLPQTVEELVGGGCSVIVATSAVYEGATQKLAAQYPRISFLQASGVEEAPNVLCYTARFYQMQYLAGVMAGRYAKNGAVGYVMAMPVPEAIRGVNAFTIGVRHSNPRATVYLRIAGSWNDDAQAAQAADRLVTEHANIDLLAGQVDGKGYLDVAKRYGIMAIGCNADISNEYPTTMLTAPIWNWDVVYREALTETTYKRISTRNFLGAIDSGVHTLARTPLREQMAAQDPGLERTISSEYERIVSGAFDAFYGPVYSNKGELMAPEGENISDHALFGTMDWYVEGVQLDE